MDFQSMVVYFALVFVIENSQREEGLALIRNAT